MKKRIVQLRNGKWVAQRKSLLWWKSLTATGNDYQYYHIDPYCWCSTREQAIDVLDFFYGTPVKIEEIS